MRITKVSGVALGALLMAGAVVGVSGTANAATPSAMASQDVDGVQVTGAPKLADEAALLDYIETHATTTTLDASTGELVAVAPVSTVSTKISQRTNCGSGDAYWASYVTPYANNCFYGTAGT